MAKRFSESGKWNDRWFRRLPPEFKLAWLYILDSCDTAGVIDIDLELAEFQIGCKVDWEQFLTQCDGRIERLESGKLWVQKFVEFQYGRLSGDCRAHNPVLVSLEKHGLLDRVSDRVSDSCFKGVSKVFQRGQDKDKDKDKVKDKDKDGGMQGGPGSSWDVPPPFDTPEVRQLLDDFETMRRKIGKPIKDVRNSSRALKEFDDAEHLAYALNFCIGNEYQGLKPEYRPGAGGVSGKGKMKLL